MFRTNHRFVWRKPIGFPDKRGDIRITRRRIDHFGRTVEVHGLVVLCGGEGADVVEAVSRTAPTPVDVDETVGVDTCEEEGVTAEGFVVRPIENRTLRGKFVIDGLHPFNGIHGVGIVLVLDTLFGIAESPCQRYACHVGHRAAAFGRLLHVGGISAVAQQFVDVVGNASDGLVGVLVRPRVGGADVCRLAGGVPDHKTLMESLLLCFRGKRFHCWRTTLRPLRTKMPFRGRITRLPERS